MNVNQDPPKRDRRYIAKLGSRKKFDQLSFVAKNNSRRKTFFENEEVYQAIKEKLRLEEESE
jgi:hypothetical protein